MNPSKHQQRTNAPAAARINTPPASTSPIEAGPVRRKRGASPQKQFAIAITQLVSILTRKEIAILQTTEERNKVSLAHELARQVTAKTIDPIKSRITAIQMELKEIGAKMTAPNADIPKLAAETTDLSKELQRKAKQLAQLTAVA
jgi:capsule polysaccharide export protein KpsE/RkpR